MTTQDILTAYLQKERISLQFWGVVFFWGLGILCLFLIFKLALQFKLQPF